LNFFESIGALHHRRLYVYSVVVVLDPPSSFCVEDLLVSSHTKNCTSRFSRSAPGVARTPILSSASAAPCATVVARPQTQTTLPGGTALASSRLLSEAVSPTTFFSAFAARTQLPSFHHSSQHDSAKSTPPATAPGGVCVWCEAGGAVAGCDRARAGGRKHTRSRIHDAFSKRFPGRLDVRVTVPALALDKEVAAGVRVSAVCALRLRLVHSVQQTECRQP